MYLEEGLLDVQQQTVAFRPSMSSKQMLNMLQKPYKYSHWPSSIKAHTDQLPAQCVPITA